MSTGKTWQQLMSLGTYVWNPRSWGERNIAASTLALPAVTHHRTLVTLSTSVHETERTSKSTC
jgi:hypothetical protein